MLTNLKKHWKKEYWLIVVGAICVILWFARHKLNDAEVKDYLTLIPTVGGALFGLNTLIQLVK